jgi:type I restriction enzyme S subunit
MRRYNQYKDSGVEWIGEIPKGWDCIRLGMMGNFSSSGIDKKSDDDEIPVRMVNYTDIIQSRKYHPIQTGEREYMKVTTPQSKLEEHRLEKGDMVLIPSSETHEDLGYSSLIDFEEEDIVYSYHILRYKTKKPIYHYFKKYLINHHSILNKFSSECKGTTRQIVGRDVFRNVRVVLPPLSEQEEIVSYLDTKTSLIDTLIENTQKKIELLKEKRTSLISEVVTKGLNPNIEMKDSGVEWIGEIPKGWKIKKIKHHSEVNVGLVINPSTYFDDNGTVPIITGKNVQVTGIDLRKVDFITEESNELLWKTKIFEGDLVSMRVGYPGRTCVVKKDESGINCCSLIITRKSNSIQSKLLEYQLNSNIGKTQVELCQGGMGQQVVNLSDWNEFFVTTPSLSEQVEIVSYLDEQTQLIDKTISVEERRIDTLKEYRQSLISEVVTGKRKVTNDE